MRGSLIGAVREYNAGSLRFWAKEVVSRRPEDLLRYRQSGGLPRLEAAGHGTDIFVAHPLQTLGGERCPSAPAAVTDDHGLRVRNFFFDIELDRAAAHVQCTGNVSLIPFLLFANVDHHRLAALQFCCGILRRNFRYLFLRFGDQFFETRVLGHAQISSHKSARTNTIFWAGRRRLLFVPERFDGVERSGFARRIKTKEDAYGGAEQERNGD